MRPVHCLGCWILMLGGLARCGLAQNAATPEDPSRFSLSIYSTAEPGTFDPQTLTRARRQNEHHPIPGYAIVRETRRLPLTKGENTIRFTDVAAGIDPTTVIFKSLTSPDSTSVVEQSFEYDVASPDRLLEKYLGRNIIINRKQEPLASDRTRMPETIEARLLAFTADHLVLQTNNKQLPIQIIPRDADVSEIKLFDVQPGLATRPTLTWKVAAEQAGEHDLLVSYQTDNITWRADYNLILNKDESKAQLSAWATIVNKSGASYPNARVKLVAGDVQRLPPERNAQRAYVQALTQAPFFEYHTYTLRRATSIPDHSVKQVELFASKSDVSISKSYAYEGAQPAFVEPLEIVTDRDLRLYTTGKVQVYLEFKNNQASGLGFPLPAGRVRVSKRDEAAGETAAGSVEFVGEDVIEHTATDEGVRLRVGNAFDVVGERRQADFAVDHEKRTLTESFEVKVRNHKKEVVNVTIAENLYRWSNWEITQASDKWQKHDSRTIHIPVQVPPGGEKTFTYRVKYTW